MAWKNSPKGRLITTDKASPRLGYARQTMYNAISSGARKLAQHPHFLLGCFPVVGGKGDALLNKVKGWCYIRQKYY